MRLEIGTGKAAVLAGCLVAMGCSAGVPAVTSAASQPHTYQVQALDDLQDVGSMIAQLPAQISAADAARVLVSIDKAAVRTDGYSLQAKGSPTRVNTKGRNDGNRENNRDRDRDRTFERGHRDRGFVNNDFLFNRSTIGYYPYGSYYFPYYNYGSYYAPYASNCTTPYLVRNSAYFYPYSFVGLNTTTGQTAPCYDAYGAPGPGLIPTYRSYWY